MVDKREQSAADAPARLGCNRRTLTFHQRGDCCKSDLQEVCWPDLVGQSPTRKTLHYESERARTDHPYCWAVGTFSTAFGSRLEQKKWAFAKFSKGAVVAARYRCGFAYLQTTTACTPLPCRVQ